MPYPHAPREARRVLEEEGIGRCWNLPYAHRAGVAAPLNRWMAETWREDPFVVPGATVHPDDDVAAVVSEAIEELRLRVFKLHCSVGRFAPEIEAVAGVARRWPRARIVIAHFGSPAVAATLRLLRETPETYADLCPVVADPVALDRAAIAGLERRILFGSDTPTVAVSIEDSLSRVRAWNLDPADEEAILGGTAEGLIP